MAAKDSRITVIKEVLGRVKHIKLYWWQTAFEDKVGEARRHELHTFLGLAVSEAFLTGIAVLMPMTMTVACLGTYMALGGLWLDRTLDTVPVFTLVLAALGIAGAFAKVYFSYRNAMSQLDADAPWVGHASSEEFRAAGLERSRADATERGAS